MVHPFEKIPPEWAKKLFWITFIASLLILLIFRVIGAPLNTDAAPSGIVSYELAGNVAKAQAIVDSWDQTARLYAAFGLGFDFLFMLVYSSAIALGCVMAAGVLHRYNWPLAKVGTWLAWGLWLAALMDAVENVALTVILVSKVYSPLPELAGWCATIKFNLILIGLVYSFLGLVVNLAWKGKHK